MVFHIMNYMRETNTWMIRKMRWIFWGIVLATPIYRNTYWDYLGRRTAWRKYWFGGSEAEQIEWAESKKADWGFTPRYVHKYDFSIKANKYANQTREEEYRDIPRLRTRSTMDHKAGFVEPKDVRTIVAIAKEHNRVTGDFNYHYGQSFYSTFPEIDQETYITLGGGPSRRVHTDQK